MGAAAWLVPARERHRFRAQWRADLWYRCQRLEDRGLVNARTAAGLAGRAAGAFRHALWLRSHSGGGVMFRHDLGYALRALRTRPGFSAIAILTLAVGIGANAVIFSWIEATLLNPIPGVADRGSLAVVHFTTATRNDLSLSYPNYLDIRDATTPGVRDVAVFGTGAVSMRTPDGAERVWGELVSGNLFDMLGVNAAQGRLLTPADDVTPGGHPVVAVSHAFWQRRLGGRTDVVGSTLTLNEHAFTVVGVTPPGFHGTQPLIALEVFIPVAMQEVVIPGDRLRARKRMAPGPGTAGAGRHPRRGAGRARRRGRAAGRDLPGRQRRPRPAPLRTVASTLGRDGHGPPGDGRPRRAGRAAPDAGVRQHGKPAAGARERTAARARRAAIARREPGTGDPVDGDRERDPALTAGILASGLARWSGTLLDWFIPPMPIPVAIDAGLNLRVLVFATLVSLIAGVLVGLVPALQASRIDLVTPSRMAPPVRWPWRRGRAREGLIVAQVALALVLLVSAGLFVRALDAARQLDPGFHATRGVVGMLDIAALGYDQAQGLALYTRLVDEAAAVPGVQAASVGQRLPLTVTDSSDRTVDVEGYTPAPGEEMNVYYASVGPGYFDTLQLPLVDGRDFSARDTTDAPMVAIVNQTMAARYWPGRPAIGGRVRVGDRWAEVVGVAGDAKYSSISEAPRAFMYLAVSQAYRPGMRLIVRAGSDPETLIPALRQAVRRVDPALPLFDVQTFEQHLAFSFFLFEMAATLLGVFGATASLLAALGLYGVVAQSVGMRTREIGVRMSLGASAADVRRMVVGQGLALAAAGVAVGLALAAVVAGLFAGQLVGVSPYDPPSYLATVVLLVAITAAACYLPARRAARLDPVRALRVE
ncbi:MAG: ABC transporter permease [Vicinamibacterales bacterium]